MDILNKIKSAIHELSSENEVYSGMHFTPYNDVLENVNFRFRFNIHENDNNYIEDSKFLLDNILSKMFELNFDVKYQFFLRTELGNFIYYNDNRIMNPFITSKYKFIEAIPFLDLENYIDDIEINILSKYYYEINWTIPIYKLDKKNIKCS